MGRGVLKREIKAEKVRQGSQGHTCHKDFILTEEFGGYGDGMFRFMIINFTKITRTWPLEGYSLVYEI